MALMTDSKSAQESNIIKSSIDESLNLNTRSVKTDTEIQSTNEKFENSESKSVVKSSNIQNLSKLTFNLKIEKENFRETKYFLEFVEYVASHININRGCGVPESLSVLEPSVCSQDFDMSRRSDTVLSETGAITERSILSEICSKLGNRRESAVRKNPYDGVPLGMFDKMIRDEDNILEHSKAILKIRDEALSDRIRGLNIKLEQERYDIQSALLMIETDIEKRRKEVDELLKWHKRLKQEEDQVMELGQQVKSVQLDDHEKKRIFTGAQVNKIWKEIESVEKKFDDHKKFQMSKRILNFGRNK